MEVLSETVHSFYSGEQMLDPAIRVSHPVKGRIPEAMGKPANLLADDEKTLYYERMMFMMELPNIRDNIAGNDLSLCVGGVRAYNHENLYSRKSEERFKIFVGFKNAVCTNLCISTDGFKADLRARTVHELSNGIFNMLSDFNAVEAVQQFKQLPEHSLSEQQFAQMIGRMGMYPFISKKLK